MKKFFYWEPLAIVAMTMTLTLVSCKDDDEYNKHGGKHEYVDLGLSSSTLWATTNVGASKPEEYGCYFAWGETKTKESYTSDNYSHRYNVEVRYNSSIDAARANWGEEWCHPSNAQWEELIRECTWTWTTQNNVAGFLVKSRKNDTSIFLPAAGRYGSSISDVGSFGGYWSNQSYSEQIRHDKAYICGFSSWFGKPKPEVYRVEHYQGLPVRPVRKK